LRRRGAVSSDVRLTEDAIHGADQGNGNEADDDTHEQDHGRLEEVREAGDLEVELCAEVVRRGLELVIERAGLFTDADHLPGRPWEEIRAGDRASEAFAPHHLLADLIELPTVNDVVRALGGDRQGVGQRYARTDHRAESPAEPFN